MHPRKSRLFRYLVPAITMFGAAVGWNSPSEAYVYQMIIDSTNTANYDPIPLGSSTPGAAVSYTIYTGRIFGVLNPNNAHNSIITDINLAAPVVAGSPNISYIANFSIVTPTNPASRNGLVIHEVPNRGGNAISTTGLIAGVTYVQSGWQGDLLSQCSGGPGSLPVSAYPCVNLNSGPYGTVSASYPFFTAPTGLTDWVIQVPVATTDGTAPNGTNTITGPVYSHIKTGSTGTTAQMVIYSSAFTPYQPVSTDTNQANFWYETSQTTYGVDNGGPTTISSADWSWAYCPSGPPGTPNPNWICLTNGATFNSSYLYEMQFQAANPLVQGVGYAATRDFDSFLRYGTTAPGGGSNPIAGSVTREMSIGVSQDGAYIRGFLFYGFNQDEDGRIVWDGAWPEIDGRILWLNVRWAQPNTLSNLYTEGFEAPVWWSDYPNQARNLPAASILDACNSTQTCPQILETFGSNEFFNNKQGADMVGFCTTCTADIPVPANVYRYYTQGATHGGGSISFNWSAPPTTPVSGSSTYPASPVPESYTNNALQSDFIGLLMNGTPMPPAFGGPGGTYPTLSSGGLAPALNQAAVGFPTIPGFPYGGNQAWPPFVYNFGPDVNYTNQTGIPTIVPPSITEIATAYVPTVNADGNETGGGLPTVLNQAPLGTYTGWNIIPPGSPYTGQQVLLTGGYWPFWDTKANRFSHNDPRLSLEERYGSHQGYNCTVRQAVNNNVAARFLLQSDATKLITMATAGNALTSFTPTVADTSLANTFCDRDSHDFNNDGSSDILWYNASSGVLAMWLMNGAQLSSSAAVATLPSNWSVAGTRDFNGDGSADILWLDSAGDVAIWLMNGATVSSFNGLGNVGTQWTVAGTGDFNGDGVGDILWRNATTGAAAIWLMSNGQFSSGVNLGVVPTTWQIVGTADFNGDGVTDILWRNSTNGALAIWFMSNGQFSSGVNVGTVSLTWTVVGTGDFNGDGVGDILWRDSAGDLAVWLMNNTGGLASSATLSGVPTTWSVAETGDFDGNGKSDILWLDTAGDLAIWFMNGLTVSSQAGLGNVGTGWQVAGQNAD